MRVLLKLGFLELLIACAVLFLGLCSVAYAQADTASQSQVLQKLESESLSEEQKRIMLSSMTDAEARALLIDLWSTQQAQQQAQRADQERMQTLSENIQLFQQNFLDSIGRWPQIGTVIPYLVSTLMPYGANWTYLLKLILVCTAVAAAAWALELWYLRLTQVERQRLQQKSSDSFVGKFCFLLIRLLMELVGLVIFALVAMGFYLLISPQRPALQTTVLSVLSAVLIFRGVIIVSRFILAPSMSSHRLLNLGCQDAAYLHKWIVVLGGFVAFVFGFLELSRRLGLEEALFELVEVLIAGSVWTLLLMAAVFCIRKPIASLMLRGEEQPGVLGWMQGMLARNWHYFFMITFLGLHLAVVYGAMTRLPDLGTAAYGSLLVIVGYPLLAVVLHGVFEDLQMAQQHTVRGRSLISPLINMGVLVAAIASIARLWGFDMSAMGETAVGARLISASLEIAVALALAYGLWLVVNRTLQPYMPAEDDGPLGPGDEGTGTGASRISTLMPLIKRTILFTLITMTVMVMLSAVGINIGPLIAGAGVVGIALGFGAQSLVRDVISGVFFLMDDAFRKGEYIEIEGIKGTVERISVRSFQLRHHNGPVHTIPYGEIKHITNFSRDWAVMKFELRIPYETDVDRVRRIIKKVGREMMVDEELSPLLIEPLKSQGVNRMDDSAFIIRCKFTAHPGHQWYLRREAYTRIQKAFEANDIQFAPRRVIVETKSSAEAAAAGSLDNLDQSVAKPA